MIIKTIWTKDPDEFDKMVNEAMQEGYQLRLRDVRPLGAAEPGLYAEMELPDEDPLQRINPIEAAMRVKLECDKVDSCEKCILQEICDFNPPNKWPPVHPEGVSV